MNGNMKLIFECKLYLSGFYREIEPIGCGSKQRKIYFKELAHIMIMEAGKTKI